MRIHLRPVRVHGGPVRMHIWGLGTGLRSDSVIVISHHIN